MMGEILILIVGIVLLFGLCFYLPCYINEEFEDKYGTKIWSWWFSIANAAALVYLVFYTEYGSISYIVGVLVVIIISVVAIYKCIKKVKDCNASKVELVKGVIAQILSTFGVLILIVFFLALIKSRDGKKKRKK